MQKSSFLQCALSLLLQVRQPEKVYKNIRMKKLVYTPLC